uniref:hypothetical protein n=1 Tax=Segatella hominis TaxID=2518605 RepID=UPI00402602B9
MKKYFDWIVEGVILSAIVVAFLFVLGHNRYGRISFKEDEELMITGVAIFAYLVALLFLYVKETSIKYMKMLPVIYALENLIIYYAAISDGVFEHSKISYEALFVAFIVDLFAWPITMYEVENLMNRK